MTPGEGELCAFAVSRGIFEGRIDPHFYLPEFRAITDEIKSVKNKRLGEIVTFSKEVTDFSDFDKEFDYLEISGVGLGTNEYVTTKTLVSEAPSRAKMKTRIGDIAISTTRPHRGAIVEIKDNGVIASTGFSIIRSVDNTINPKWLLYVLLSKSSLLQMLQRSSGGNYPAIVEEELKRIYIPVNYAQQEKMAKELDSALLKRALKLQEANELLAGNSMYLLSKLGLKFDSSIEAKNVYVLPLGALNGRIDADYYSPKFTHFRKQIEELPFDTVSIGDISEKITTGFAAGKQDQADNLPDEQRVPQLRPFSITPEGELSFNTMKYIPKIRLKSDDYCKMNEVLFNNTNSPDLVGKTTVFDSDVLCTASNHMTRITLKDGINPYYVAAFFNVLLSIGYWKLLCTNFNNQAGVNVETLKSVRIPLPEKEIQDQIVSEIMWRRSTANRLRKEAESEWQAAKEQFEKELLG